MPEILRKFQEVLKQGRTKPAEVMKIAEFVADRFGFPAGKYQLSKSIASVEKYSSEEELAGEIDSILKEKTLVESQIKEISGAEETNDN